MDDSPRSWAAVVGGATAVALFFGAQNLVGRAVRGRPLAWVETLGTELFYWYLLAAFLPLVVWLAGRVRISRWNRIRALAVHSLAALAIGVSHSILYYVPLAILLGVSGPLSVAVGRQVPTAVMTVFWKYWVVIGVYYAFDYHRKFRERQQHAAALERSLVEARLEALRMQLHPHFLFNTLHTVSMLNLEDPVGANRVLSRLGELLRVALDRQGEQEVRLIEELEFIRDYLDIEGVRFEDRLVTDIRVPPELFDAYVPNLVLQPLVENAVRHGLAPRREPGRIEVEARLTGDVLVLQVADDGPGLEPDGATVDGRGIGIENTRKRLTALYGDAGSLRLRSSPGGGMRAVVALPFHTEPWSDRERPA